MSIGIVNNREQFRKNSESDESQKEETKCRGIAQVMMV